MLQVVLKVWGAEPRGALGCQPLGVYRDMWKLFLNGKANGNLMQPTWTPKVCNIMALGLLFYILLGLR